MKRLAFALLFLAAAQPSFADERAEKLALIQEILKVIDAKALTQASFDLIADRGAAEMARTNEHESEEVAAALKKEVELRAQYRERVFAYIDHVKYAEEIYEPLFDEHFNIAELKELLAFYKTKAGQKSVRLLPDLLVGGMLKGSVIVNEAEKVVAAEMAKEESQKHPERHAMADIRTIASAVESRATDENNYPDVDITALTAMIQPIYILKVPPADPWGTPYLYVGNGNQYRIVSAGPNKRFEWNARQFEANDVQPRLTTETSDDVIFQDGRFIQAPLMIPRH